MELPPNGPVSDHGPPRNIQGLIQALDNSQIASRCIVIATTIFVFDYFLTLPSEVKYLWPANRSLGNFLYVILRISGFLGVILSCLGSLNTSKVISPHACTVMAKVGICINTLGISISESTLSMRVWATWNYNRWWGLVLLVALVGGGIPAYTFLAPAFTNTHFSRPPLPGNVGCWHASGLPPRTKLLISYILLIFNETAILVVSLVKGWEMFKYRPSRFIRTLYRDSLLYYIGALGISLVNILTFTFNPAISLFLEQHVLHCVFIGRMILNLRETAYKEKTLGQIRTDSWGAQISFDPGLTSDNDHVGLDLLSNH
ncbi:hypothetical protein M422DRAFT_27404 [Sphaerobolus stellatus SS14]|nr:hypothetical protein M422DRAFT_27404 [Sphaerobolus stellatus SS14]